MPTIEAVGGSNDNVSSCLMVNTSFFLTQKTLLRPMLWLHCLLNMKKTPNTVSFMARITFVMSGCSHSLFLLIPG